MARFQIDFSHSNLADSQLAQNPIEILTSMKDHSEIEVVAIMFSFGRIIWGLEEPEQGPQYPEEYSQGQQNQVDKQADERPEAEYREAYEAHEQEGYEHQPDEDQHADTVCL